MSRYRRHIFVCTNKRPPGHPKGCCSEKGSEEVRALFKAELKKRGLSTMVRANISGCLDACEFGVSVVVYPEGVWYGGVTKGNVEEIIERHIVNGQVIERLRIRDQRFPQTEGNLPPLQEPQK